MSQRSAGRGSARRVAARPVGRLVGRRVAALRVEKRLTLEAVATGTGLTPSFLSKLERGQTSISVDNLRTIAHFLDVEMVHFFDRQASNPAILTRNGEGTTLGLSNTTAVGESLITTSTSILQATLYRTPPGQGRRVGFSHPGEEFVYVIRGRVQYWAGDAEFVLRPGDSLWHRSTEPHRWKNTGRTNAVTLHVNTPPVW